MAGFIYYIPGRSQPIPHRDRIPAECELQNVFKDVETISHGYTFNGPDGGPGMLFCIADNQTCHCEEDAQVRAEKQKWKEIKKDGRTTHWVGFDKASPPTPKDLARPKMLTGKLVALGDGNQWELPVIYAERTSFIKGYELIDGCIAEVPLPGNEQIIRDAEKWFDIIMQIRAEDKATFKPWDMFTFASDVMGINYRVGFAECLCGTNFLTNDMNVFSSFLNAVYGLEDIREENEAQKKTTTQPDG